MSQDLCSNTFNTRFPGLRGDAALAVLCMILFVPLASGGTIGLDDGAYFVNNQVITKPGIEGLWGAWTSRVFGYEPLTLTTIWLDLQIFGQEAWACYRLHSLLWFIVWILSIRRLVKLLTGNPTWGWCIAAACAIHPVDSPLVLWPALRRQVVCLAFTFWGLVWILRSTEGRLDRRFWYGLLLGVCGIWSRFSGVMLVALTLAIERWRLPRGSLPGRTWYLRWSIHIGLSGMAGLAVLLAAHSTAHQPYRLGDSFLGTVALDGPILLQYLKNCIQPWALCPYYGINETISASTLISWLGVCVAVTVSCLVCAKHWRMALLNWLLAFIALAPCLNIVNQAYVMADHYLAPALPFLLIVIAFMVQTAMSWTSITLSTRQIAALLAPVLIALALGTIARSPSFKDRGRFLSDSLEANPESGFLLAYQCHWAMGQSGEAARLAAPSGAAAWLAHDLRRTPLDPQLATVIAGIPRLIAYFGPDKTWQIIQQQATSLPGNMITLAQAWHLTLTHRPQLALPLIQSITCLEGDSDVFERCWLEFRGSGKLPGLIGGKDPLAVRQSQDRLNEAYTSASMVALTQGLRARIERESGLPLIAAKRALFCLRITCSDISVWNTFIGALTDLGLSTEAEHVRLHVGQMTNAPRFNSGMKP